MLELLKAIEELIEKWDDYSNDTTVSSEDEMSQLAVSDCAVELESMVEEFMVSYLAEKGKKLASS